MEISLKLKGGKEIRLKPLRFTDKKEDENIIRFVPLVGGEVYLKLELNGSRFTIVDLHKDAEEDKDELNNRIEENTKSPKVSDQEILLMGINLLDLSNEKAIKQEQDDLAEVTKVNELTIPFTSSLEFYGEIDFSQVDNSETVASQYNVDDTTSSIFNLSEDEYGCGF